MLKCDLQLNRKLSSEWVESEWTLKQWNDMDNVRGTHPLRGGYKNEKRGI